MKAKDLRDWLFTHTQEDRWFVSSGGHVFQELFSIKDVETYARQTPSAEIKLLHVSYQEMESPPWIDFEYDQQRKDFTGVAEKPVSKARPVSSARVASTGAVAHANPSTWRMRQRRRPRRTSVRSIREAEKSMWSTEKIGGLAALVCLALLVVGIMVSSEPANTGNDSDASAPITSKDAYYAGQQFIRSHVGGGEITFPTDRAEGVFHEEVKEDMFKVHGFMRIASEGSSRFESYDMIARHNDQTRQWELLYLKSGPVVVGAIPTGLNSEQRSFVAKR